MKNLTLILFVVQSCIVATYAAPAPACILPAKFKANLLILLNKDLGPKFVEDFNSVYQRTITVAQIKGVPCYDQQNGEFICSTLKTIYSTRLPKSLKTVTDDCEKVLDDFYAV